MSHSCDVVSWKLEILVSFTFPIAEKEEKLKQINWKTTLTLEY